MHVEGALKPDLLFTLATQNSVELPTNDTAFASVETLLQRYSRFNSLDDFLHYYYIGMSVLIAESDFEALAWSYFEQASADGVAHAEISFDPQAHLSRGIAFDVIVSGIEKARLRAERELGISSELICCFLRHLGGGEALKTFELQELQDSIKNGHISGIGLDSSEKDYPPELFKDLFHKAKEGGVKRTAHAGEEGPAAYIRDAIDILEVQRIDHGIKLSDDDSLLDQIAQKRIMLTLCPLSNVVLRCANSVAELPIRKFLDA